MACIIDIIPSLGLNICAKTTRTCQIMKWTDVKHPKCEVVLSAAAKSKIPCLMHDSHLCQKMLNLLISSTELKRYKYKTCYYAKTCEYHKAGATAFKKITYYVKSKDKRPDTRSLIARGL